MTDQHEREPQSLLALTNWQSRAIVPSEVYDRDFKVWAHSHGAHIYMVLVGPKIEICDLVQEADGWRLRTLFHNGVAMKPRTIPVPFELLPEKSTKLVDGAIEWTDAGGKTHRSSAVQVTRKVLEHAVQSRGKTDPWLHQTIRKFFTYTVRYVGQAYGQGGERTAAERIGQGHKQVQQVLSEVADFYPSAAVAVIVMDAQVQGREASLSVGPDNREATASFVSRFLATPDGPLVEQSKLVTVAEAMLIRSFPEAQNIQYKHFPLKDAPALVTELLTAGISHLGIQIDVSESFALIRYPESEKAPANQLRFAVNLRTGAREALSTGSPMAWRAH